jgi:hypothetical protein
VQRQRQALEEIVASLAPVQTTWRDSHADTVIRNLGRFSDKTVAQRDLLGLLLREDFEAALTTIRLVLDLSEDEFRGALRRVIGARAVGVKVFQLDPRRFLAAIDELGFGSRITQLMGRAVTWRDILIERLKSGRGSAIKGQRRGRALEDFVEESLKAIFGPEGYKARCRFKGRSGTSSAKADFAVPGPLDPRILVEAKAYGATGSKQTDILGDAADIVSQKRHDTQFFLVTDGPTWRDRMSDLRKLVEMQNQGAIARIYTQAMRDKLIQDLRELKKFHRL